MKHYYLVTIGVTATALLLYAATQTTPSAPTLNQIMTPEEQVRTGVNKLSPEERNELEEWVKSYAQTKANKGKKNTPKPSFGVVTINALGGRFLILFDGSVWEVAPDDTFTASAWLTSVPLEITYDTSDPNAAYPYTLKNQSSGLSVHARTATIDDIPEPTPPSSSPGGQVPGMPSQAPATSPSVETPAPNEVEGTINPSSSGETSTDQASSGDEGTTFSNPSPPPRTQPLPNRQQQTTPNQHTPTAPQPTGVPSFSVTTPTD